MKDSVSLLVFGALLFLTASCGFKKVIARPDDSLIQATESIYNFEMVALTGEVIDFKKYKGKKLLIVNTASECGFTPQYEGLQALYENHEDNNFTILGFPCNQFSEQEPGSHEEIKTFCTTNYDITFPLFEKIDVNGDNTHPLYKFLKSEATGVLWSESIKWNFTKFLVDKNGEVISRYGSSTKPKDIEADILKLLEAK
jgi:glutathione peroxidase